MTTNKIKTLFKDYWKGVTTIVGIIGVMTALVAFDARYAKSNEIIQLDNKKTIEIKQVESNTVNTLKEFKKSLEMHRDIDRLNALNDRLMQLKLLMKTYPKDQELKEDYENIKAKRDKLQEELEKKTQE